ncbi:MAG: hypothetical protein ABI459_11235 [Deltaproteobacteria bacterium]
MQEKLGSNWIIYVMASLLLVASALKRLTFEAHEYASSSAIWLQIAIDVGLIAGIIGLRPKLMRVLPEGDWRRRWITPLFIMGLIAGIVIMILRVSSKHGWATGHLHYDCCK